MCTEQRRSYLLSLGFGRVCLAVAHLVQARLHLCFLVTWRPLAVNVLLFCVCPNFLMEEDVLVVWQCKQSFFASFSCTQSEFSYLYAFLVHFRAHAVMPESLSLLYASVCHILLCCFFFPTLSFCALFLYFSCSSHVALVLVPAWQCNHERCHSCCMSHVSISLMCRSSCSCIHYSHSHSVH